MAAVKPGQQAATFGRINVGRNPRPPLPAGHALTWGAITAGTVLAGAKYTPPTPPVGRAKLVQDNIAAPVELKDAA